jgi:hypothetical protein
MLCFVKRATQALDSHRALLRLGPAVSREQLTEATGPHVRPAGWHDDLHFRTLFRNAADPEVRADPFGTLGHAAKSPMTIAVVCAQSVGVKTAAVVATRHAKLALLVVQFHYDSRRLRVTEGVRKSLARDVKNFIHNVILECIASSLTF